MTLRDTLIERLARKMAMAEGYSWDDPAWENWKDDAAAAFDAMTPPLVWTHYSDKINGFWECKVYTIESDGPDFLLRSFYYRSSLYPTLAAAQAAAEDHYLRKRYQGTKLMEGLE